MLRDHVLFNEGLLPDYLSARKLTALKEVRSIQADRTINCAPSELSNTIAKKYFVIPIALQIDEVSVESQEARIDVSRDSNRFIFDRDEPFFVDGIRVKYYVAFTGDASAFRYRPSQFTFNLPMASIEGTELILSYEEPDRKIIQTKSKFERDIQAIQQWLTWSNTQIEQFNTDLKSAVQTELQNRRKELADSQKLIYELGFKVREKAVSAPANALPQQCEKQSESANLTQDYDVALSFAGEDRAYVDQVANELREAGVKVFYDKFEAVNLWGKDLASKFANVYSKQCRYVVMFISASYAAKAWPTHEREHAIARRLLTQHDAILPARFDDTELPGIPGTLGYIDLRSHAPSELSTLIIKKLKESP